MWTSVGAGALESAPLLALKRVLPAPKRFLRGRGAARLNWAEALNQCNGFGLRRFSSGRDTRTVPGWSIRYSRVRSWTLRGSLGEGRYGGIGNVLVPWQTERGGTSRRMRYVSSEEAY